MVAAVDITDSFLLFRSRQLPTLMLASPTLHRPPAPTGCLVGIVWSRGLLEADVAIANAAAALDVLLLQQDSQYGLLNSIIIVLSISQTVCNK